MRLSLVFAILWLSFAASANERLGTLEVDELHIKTHFTVQELQEASFGFEESSFSLQWKKSEVLSAHIALGSLELANEPVHFVSDANQTTSLGLIEAYGQIDGVYGRIRAGMIPVEFGVGGSKRESQLFMPRQLLYQNRVVGLRDLGLSLQTDHNGYYTRLNVHNGEGGQSNPDSRVWLTSQFGWTNYRNLNIGFASQTGTTKPVSTTSSGSTLAGIDNDEEAQWRLGALVAHWHPNEWDILLEAYYGEKLQDNAGDEQFLGGHFDLGYRFENFGIIGRYDHFDPNQGQDNDLVKQISLSLAYFSPFQTSSFYVVAIKKIEETTEIRDDEIRFVWRLTPFVTR